MELGLHASGELTSIVNPQIKIVVTGIGSELIVETLACEYDVLKDRDPEPNEAVIKIYNLNETHRNYLIDPSYQECPVQLYATPAGSDEYVKLFFGEVHRVVNTPLYPGWETVLECTSQDEQHKIRSISKTYAAGTPIRTILNDMVDLVGLPTDISTVLPTGTILLSASFSGPAFPLLRQFCYDYGLYCFVLDGVLKISDVYEPTNPQVITLRRSQLLRYPFARTFNEAETVEQQSVLEATSGDVEKIISRGKSRNKKTTKKKITTEDLLNPEAPSYDDVSNDMTYDVVDTEITGMEFEVLLNPRINPDDIITVDVKPTEDARLFGKRWRVREVHHTGTERGGSTIIGAVDYDGDVTAGLI